MKRNPPGTERKKNRETFSVSGNLSEHPITVARVLRLAIPVEVGSVALAHAIHSAVPPRPHRFGVKLGNFFRDVVNLDDIGARRRR